MTPRKITLKVNQKPDAPGADFAALAEQLIQESWHLPPEGDQSWREMDARRIFSADGKSEINDADEPPPAAEDAEEEVRWKPGFRASRMIGVLLPISLGAFVLFFAVALSVPEVLTAGFWQSPEYRAAPVALAANAAPAVPAPQASEAGPGNLRPSLADRANASEPIRKARAIAEPKYDRRERPGMEVARTGAQPLRPSRAGGTVRRKPVIALAKAEPLREASARKNKSTRLPPIGAAYFARRAAAVEASDWKTEAARWDEKAAEIRAKSEKYRSSGNVTLAATPATNVSEFP